MWATFSVINRIENIGDTSVVWCGVVWCGVVLFLRKPCDSHGEEFPVRIFSNTNLEYVVIPLSHLRSDMD